MSELQLLHKREGESLEELSVIIEDIISKYNGQTVMYLDSRTQRIFNQELRFKGINDLPIPIDKVYEIQEHGTIVCQLRLGNNQQFSYNINTPTGRQNVQSDGMLLYLGFKTDDQVYIDLKKDLSILI